MGCTTSRVDNKIAPSIADDTAKDGAARPPAGDAGNGSSGEKSGVDGGPDDVGGDSRREQIASVLETVQGYIESADELKDKIEGIGKSADSLTALLASHQSEALAVLGECSDMASRACTSIAPALAFVAPAMIFLGIILKEVSAVVSLPAVAAALARRCAVLRPILKAATKSDTMALENAALLQTMSAVLEDTVKVIERSVGRKGIMAFIDAGSDQAALASAGQVGALVEPEAACTGRMGPCRCSPRAGHRQLGAASHSRPGGVYGKRHCGYRQGASLRRLCYQARSCCNVQ